MIYFLINFGSILSLLDTNDDSLCVLWLNKMVMVNNVSVENQQTV